MSRLFARRHTTARPSTVTAEEQLQQQGWRRRHQPEQYPRDHEDEYNDYADGSYEHPATAYSSLLDPSSDILTSPVNPSSTHPHSPTSFAIPMRRRAVSASAARTLGGERPWLFAASTEGGYGGVGRRPPNKLVKDPSGSARPSFSVEISDSDGEKDGASAAAVTTTAAAAGASWKGKAMLRRRLSKLKELYRRGDGDGEATEVMKGGNVVV